MDRSPWNPLGFRITEEQDEESYKLTLDISPRILGFTGPLIRTLALFRILRPTWSLAPSASTCNT